MSEPAEPGRAREGGAIFPPSVRRFYVKKIGQKGVLSNPYTPMNLASMIELKMA